MRKFMRSGFLVALVGLVALSSCDDNEEIIPTDPNAEYDAVLELAQGGGDENVNVTVDANTQSEIKARVTFTSNDVDMRRLYITQNVGGQGAEPYEITVDADKKADGSIDIEAANSNSVEYALTLEVPSGVDQGTVVYTLWTTTGRGDYRDHSQRLAVGVGTITLNYGGANPEAEVKSYSAILLAAPLADGSSKTFVSLLDGQTYRIDQGEEYAAFWDFGYYYGVSGTSAGDNASLASASAYEMAFGSDANGNKFVPVSEIAGTTELNHAYFQRPSTTIDFDAIAVAGDLDYITASSDENITNLVEGEIIEFVDNYGKKGLIRVVEIVGTYESTDYIKLDIKVQP